ncbi:hypothetical protein Hdeb2414_s0009g00315611 [Helianthus debilis subsp. tardiflorus]
MFESLVNNSVCLQQHDIVHVSNAILNSVELDETVAMLTVV